MTQNEIARLVIRLQATTGEVQPALNQVAAQVKTFASSVTSTLKTLAAGFSLAYIASGMKNAILGAQGFAAEMSRMAEKVGVPIEQLTALADAADKSGVSTEGLGIGLKLLSRNLFEASRGGGDLREIMKEMNVSFESSPGVIRPAMDILLDLADQFSQMEDGAGKTAIAMKIFGKSGAEMVPFLNRGGAAIRKMIGDAQKFGTVIDSETGRKAREFGNTIKEIGDAIKGLSIGIMSALLPSMQDTSSGVLTLAERINGLRLRLTEIGEALRYVGAVAIAAVIVQIGSMVSAIGVATVALRALAASLAFLSGPIGVATIALGAVAAAYVYGGKEAREAARAHEAYVAAVGKLDPAWLQKNVVILTNYLAVIRSKIAEAQKEIDSGGPIAQPQLMGVLKQYEAEAQSRLSAVQKLQEAVAKTAKVAAPIITDPAALKALQDKTAQLGAELKAFQDPVKGASAAIEEFIRQTIGAAPATDALKKAANSVRAAFQVLFKAQQDRANVAAAEKGTFAMSVAGWESYGQDLQRQFDNGLIDIRSFFQERRSLIEAQTAAEILLLQAEKGKKETTPARRIEIDAEIAVKGIKVDATIKKELADETAAWTALGETSLDFEQRMAEAQGRVLDGKRKALEIDMQAYEVGLRSKGVSASDAKKQADDLLAAKSKEIDFNEQLREFSIEMADLDIRKQKIQDDLAIGVGDQYSAEAATMDLERQRIPVLQKMADEAARLAAASKDPALLQQVEGLNAAIRQLGISTDESGRRFVEFKKKAQDALINGFANFLSRGIAEAKTFGEAVKNMAKNFVQAMVDIVAQMIATMAVKAMFNAIMGLSGGGGVGEASAGADGNFGQGPPMASGGPVRGPGTGTSDSIFARLSDGEFVHPAAAVRYYGPNVMEAIRRMLIPRNMLSGFGRFAVATPGGRFADGGLVAAAAGAGGGGKDVTIQNTYVFSKPDMKQEILENSHIIEGITFNALRQGGLLRDGVRRFR